MTLNRLQPMNDPATQRIFFVHIPKAAGTSVNEYFARVFGAKVCAFHLESYPHVLAAIAGPGYNHIKVASGHVRFPHVRDVVAKDQWRILTFLRNPVTHLLSHLLWVKHIGNPSAGEFRKKHSSHIQEIALRLYEIPLRRIDLVQKLIFDEFSEARQLFDNCQTRYLIPRVDRKIEPLDVNLAIANLAFVDFVFCVEQAPDAMPLVAQRLGVAKELLPDLPHSNQARLREHGPPG